MYPVPSSRFAPVRIDDYNHMIKELKRLCMTHRNLEGEAAPLIWPDRGANFPQGL